MITGYEIRGTSGDETLYLYLDFASEFAKLGKRERKKKFSELIADFLKKNDIKFDGKKIAIISGGLLVATLVVNSLKPNVPSGFLQSDYQQTLLLKTDELANTSQAEEIDKAQAEKKDENLEQSSSEAKTKAETTSSIINKTTTTSKKQTTDGTKAKPTTSQPNISMPSVSAKEEKPNTTSATPVPVVPQKNLVYVNVHRSNGQIVNLELEEYIVGVVGAEMPASFGKEALKAQAVIARTYALRAIEKGTVLTDDSRTQNYKSNEQLRAMWGSTFQTYYQKVKNAVKETEGQYLTYNNVIIDAVYHSTSNGRTEDSKFVWGNAFPYLVSVESPYDETNRSFLKEIHLTYEEISSKLGVPVTAASNIEIVSKTIGNRNDVIAIDGNTFSGVMIRNKLGLRSADFDMIQEENGIKFTTRGYGHGVGLSQYGANGMATHGYDHIAILKHYYRGVNLSHL